MKGRLRRHRLLLYTRLIDRWWQATLTLFFALGVLTAGLQWLPALLPRSRFMQIAGLLLVACGAALFYAAIKESRRYFSGRLRVTEPDGRTVNSSSPTRSTCLLSNCPAAVPRAEP